MISRYHCLLNFFTFGCLLIFQFCMFLLNIGFFQISKKSLELFLGRFYMDWTCFLEVLQFFWKQLNNSVSTKFKDMRSKKIWLSYGSTQFVTWFRRRWLTTKFLKNEKQGILHWNQWRTQKIFMGVVLVQGHMVVICVWCWLFVTSQFDIICMFPNQRFGDVSWHNYTYFSTSTPLISCGIALNINYQRSKLGYRRKINSTLRHSSS